MERRRKKKGKKKKSKNETMMEKGNEKEWDKGSAKKGGEFRI